VKLLLFDVDQTLVSTGGAGLRALDRACRKILALESATEGINPSGKTDPAIVREILNRSGIRSGLENHLDSVLESYLAFLREEVQTSEKYSVLPGIFQVLEDMSGRSDVMLGLATGNIEMGARVKLDRGGLNRYFAFGGFGSDSEHRAALVQKAAEAGARKYGSAILPDDVFVIGDTPLDVDAGRAAGFKTIGVATGRYSRDQLLQSGATFAISDFHQGRDHFLRSTFMA
jgi:phosphoglycolate phosphatase-like HAD superfamily hydrolase